MFASSKFIFINKSNIDQNKIYILDVTKPVIYQETVRKWLAKLNATTVVHWVTSQANAHQFH
jgi:hypothetical protein